MNQIEILPNEFLGVSITHQSSKSSLQLEGTVMGGINFNQIMGLQTAEDSSWYYVCLRVTHFHQLNF